MYILYLIITVILPLVVWEYLCNRVTLFYCSILSDEYCLLNYKISVNIFFPFQGWYILDSL